MENDNLLVVENLKKYYPINASVLGKAKSFVKAVDDVSFTIKRGTTMGLVGESGCGKTTVGRKHNIVPKSQYQSYIRKVMKDCGLQPQYFYRYPHEFSGGQRQRICIARAVALNPEFIICDEPVSALDVSIQAQIINLMKDLQTQFGYTYLFISHDLSVVEHISDTIGVMYLGNLVETGDKAKIFANPMHPYTKALLSAVPMPDPDMKMNRIILKGDIPSPANPPSGCKFRTRCQYCMDVCEKEVPQFREYEPGHRVACHLYSQE